LAICWSAYWFGGIHHEDRPVAPRFIARQLSCPTGLLGRVIARLMNRYNSKMNAFAVEQLELRPADRVLEIGFGGGVTLPSLIGGAAFVGGVDRSRDAVQRANLRHSAAVKGGRAAFREGSIDAIPFETSSFEKVCTVNTVYFWPSLAAGFVEIHRVLQPGGRVVVGFLPKEWMDRLGYPADIFTSRTPDQVVAALTSSGFTAVHVERPEPSTRWNVIVATR
jgi:arsenite methyltransferase